MVLSRPGGFNPSEASLDELSKAAMMLFDVWMEEDEPHSVTGVVMVEDIKDFSLSHFTALTPVAVKKMMTLFQVFCLASSRAWCHSTNGKGYKS